MSNIKDSLRHAGGVKRYHTWPTTQTQTVADHTYHVIRIYSEIFGPPSWDVLHYLIYHDSPEVVSGDPPFPIKRDNPDLKAAYDKLDDKFYEEMFGGNPAEHLSHVERVRAKVADLLEMWEFGMVDLRMGNTYADLIVTRTLAGALSLAEQKLSTEDTSSICEYVEKSRGTI